MKFFGNVRKIFNLDLGTSSCTMDEMELFSRFNPLHRTCVFKSERYDKNIKNMDRDNRYAFDIDDYYTIIGEKTFTHNTDYLGHFINDCDKCPKDKSGHVKYLKEAEMKCNCKFYALKGDLHIAMVATKDIDKGEELFVRYGISYWMNYSDE